MRDLIGCLVIWLGEPARRLLRTMHRRVSTWFYLSPPAAVSVIPPRPSYDRGPLPEHVLARQRSFVEHEAIVRPFYAEWERSPLSARADQPVPAGCSIRAPGPR